MARKVEAVLFDIGGVLLELDFQPLFRFLHWSTDASVAAAMNRLNDDEDYDAFERGKFGADEFRRRVETRMGKTLEARAFTDAWNTVLVRTFPGIETLLDRLHGRVPLFALTNSNEIHVAEMRRRFDWLPKMDRIVSSHEIDARKPEPEAFSRTLERIGFPAESVLYFDDRQDNVDGALRAGLLAKLVRRSPEDVQVALNECGLLS